MTRLAIVNVTGSGAIVAAVLMLVLGLLGWAGVYDGALRLMQEWHAFYGLSVGGAIAGMIEAAVITFIVLAAFAWLPNYLGERTT